MNTIDTQTRDYARLVLRDIRADIRRRHGRAQHDHFSKFVESSRFFWLCEVAALDPHDAREHLRNELEAAEKLGFAAVGRPSLHSQRGRDGQLELFFGGAI